MDDVFYMKEALKLAEKAAELGETPVGAVVVRKADGKIVGKGFNMREKERNSILHAEIIAIEQACKALGGWRISGCVLYVTLEPCPMCAGAVINSRIDSVKFGAYDKKSGSVGSVINLFEQNYNHKPDFEGGILADECEKMLKKFFISLREKNKGSTFKLIPVKTAEQINKTALLADEIWHEFFPSVISMEQIDYMVKKFQSAEAIGEQIENNGYLYFLMHKNGNYAGYFAVKQKDDGRLFLSKIYIKKEFRGKGAAKQAFLFLQDYCSQNGLNAIWLTVNKNNKSAIDAYKKSGFEIFGSDVKDIGHGFVMDDYFMEKCFKS